MEGKLRNMTCIYLLKGENIFLLYRQGGKVVNNVWIGSAGGHFENYELNDAKACVLREMNEELGLEPSDIENLMLRYITLRKTNIEIRQNYYFFADVKKYVSDNLISNEGVCKWFHLDDIHSLEMPHTAKYVMEHYCATGRYTDKTYIGISNTDKADFFELSES